MQICHCANCGAEIEYRIPLEDFDYDVLQKKRTARGAQHRKGSKSKRCILPHELMTKKELRAMNGPMKT